jgi:hypothetical protein
LINARQLGTYPYSDAAVGLATRAEINRGNHSFP